MSNYISNGNIDIAICDDAIRWLKAIKIHYIHGDDETLYACRKRAIDVGCEALELLKEQEAMNVDSFAQWCIDSHIMGDATVMVIKYWVEKYKETKEGR